METTSEDVKGTEEQTTSTELKASEEQVPTKEVAKETEDTGNEFEYLKRNEFTSEIYKIEVRNLGYFGIGVSFRIIILLI